MAEVNVGSVDSFSDPGRRVFEVNGKEIGIFRIGSEFYAWENMCPHLGGPACLGLIIPRTEEALNEDRTSRGREFAKGSLNIVCPWHGMEFDVRTGVHSMESRMRLRGVGLKVLNNEIWLDIN